MEPLTLIVGSALLAALVLYTGYPLFTSRLRFQTRSLDSRSRQLQDRKERLYVAIKELDFDRQLCKLSQEDFGRLHRQLESEALDIIRQQDNINGSTNSARLDAYIEKEVRARRRTTNNPKTCCPCCQTEYRPGDLFCPQCGTGITVQEQRS